MITRGLHFKKAISDKTTLITMDPGTVNTKMLLAGWGRCGMEVQDATDTFMLATRLLFENKDKKPK